MATSSILENIRVNNPSVIEEFVKAMEANVLNSHQRTDSEKSHVVSDPERIKAFVKKNLEGKGLKK